MDNKKSALPYKNLTEYRFKHVFPSSPFYEKTSFKVGREYRVDLPESWSTTEDDTWRYCFPDCYELPLQGWKIHISVRPGMEDFVLDNNPTSCSKRVSHLNLERLQLLSINRI